MTKEVSIVVEDENTVQKIRIYCNNVLKCEISENNTIDANCIYDSLEYEDNVDYKLLPMNKDIENKYPKIFKPFSELYELYNKIITEINNIEN